MSDNQSDRNANDSRDQNQRAMTFTPIRGFFGGHRRSKRRAWVLGGIAYFFLLGGGILFNVHNAPPWLDICLILVGGMFSAFTARQSCINNPKWDKSRNWAFWPTAFGFLVLCVTLLFFEYRTFSKAQPESKPRLILALESSEFPQTALILTNRDLLFTNASNVTPTNG